MSGSRSSTAHGVAGLAVLALLATAPTAGAQGYGTAPRPAVPAAPTPLPVPRAQTTAQAQPAPAATAPAAPGEAGGRDPFEPLVRPTGPGGGPARVAQLKLVGVLWDSADKGRIQALVEMPNGLGYYLRLNDERFDAKVVAIEPDRVRFSVREQDPVGQVQTRTVELKLRVD